MVNTREAAKMNNLTYGQIDYLIRLGVISPPDVKQGQTRILSDRDLWVVELAGAMRKKGLRIDAIKKAVLPVSQMYDFKPIGFFYIYDDPKLMFAALWDTKQWNVETVLIEIFKLYSKAVGSHMPFFLGGRSGGNP